MSGSTILAIAGLRNPGERYAETRHNAGSWFVEQLSNHYPIRLSTEKKFSAEIGKVTINERSVAIILPNTFMNLSGSSIVPFLSYYRIPVNQLLVIHDELDLPAGCVRIKKSGGHGGHNGIRDTINKLNSNDFVRLRVGIGHPGNNHDVSNYVLNKPSRDEQISIERGIKKSIEVLPLLLDGEIEKAMTALHGATIEKNHGN